MNNYFVPSLEFVFGLTYSRSDQLDELCRAIFKYSWFTIRDLLNYYRACKQFGIDEGSTFLANAYQQTFFSVLKNAVPYFPNVPPNGIEKWKIISENMKELCKSTTLKEYRLSIILLAMGECADSDEFKTDVVEGVFQERKEVVEQMIKDKFPYKRSMQPKSKNSLELSSLFYSFTKRMADGEDIDDVLLRLALSSTCSASLCHMYLEWPYIISAAELLCVAFPLSQNDYKQKLRVKIKEILNSIDVRFNDFYNKNKKAFHFVPYLCTHVKRAILNTYESFLYLYLNEFTSQRDAQLTLRTGLCRSLHQLIRSLESYYKTTRSRAFPEFLMSAEDVDDNVLLEMTSSLNYRVYVPLKIEGKQKPTTVADKSLWIMRDPFLISQRLPNSLAQRKSDIK